MKRLMRVAALIGGASVLTVGLGGCVSDDYQWVNSRSLPYYEARGFKVLGYQGYNMWTTGRCYWYTLQRGNTVYESCLLKWGEEVHEYGLKAVDALKGTS